MNEQETPSRTIRCPLCRGAVPPQIVTLRGSFNCPSCGKSLKIPGGHELIIRLIGVAFGFLVAYRLGLESLWLFFFGLMISPFLIIAVWKIWTAVRPPVLIPAAPNFIALNLRGGPLK